VKQQIYNSKNELACEAEFTIGFMDLVERKLISASTDWDRALGFDS
jgi:acyl-CoA thioesterase FadM